MLVLSLRYQYITYSHNRNLKPKLFNALELVNKTLFNQLHFRPVKTSLETISATQHPSKVNYILQDIYCIINITYIDLYKFYDINMYSTYKFLVILFSRQCIPGLLLVERIFLDENKLCFFEYPLVLISTQWQFTDLANISRLALMLKYVQE